MTITKQSDGNFKVVTGTLMTGHNPVEQDVCRLDGNVLRTFDVKGVYRVARHFHVTLGPKSFALVSQLQPGETLTVNPL